MKRNSERTDDGPPHHRTRSCRSGHRRVVGHFRAQWIANRLLPIRNSGLQTIVAEAFLIKLSVVESVASVDRVFVKKHQPKLPFVVAHFELMDLEATFHGIIPLLGTRELPVSDPQRQIETIIDIAHRHARSTRQLTLLQWESRRRRAGNNTVGTHRRGGDKRTCGR